MAVIAAGLGVRAAVDGVVAKAAGDALYAVLIYLLVAFLAPRARWLPVALLSLAVCTAVELFQITGLPAAWAARWPPVRLVLGTGFGWPDLAWYLLGVMAAAAVDGAVRRRLSPPDARSGLAE